MSQRPDETDESETFPPGAPGAVPLLRGGMDRVQVLLETRRYADAERELRRQLGENPNDAVLHTLLSLALGAQEKNSEATDEARRAIGLDPLEPGGYHALASSLLSRDRPDEALAAIAEALQLNPFNAAYHSIKSAALLEKRDWPAALKAADEGLACDPEDDSCRNLRAMALRQLGRRAEAESTIRDQLRKSPDDAFMHANQGWSCLHRGDYPRALEHFRESLRLDPTLEYAREGILEALKARNPVYRALLRWKLWMSTLSGRSQWVVLIALYVIYRATGSIARTNPGLRPILWPLMGLYIGFVLLTWAGDPVFDSLLRLSRFGRLALTDSRRHASNVFLGAMAVLAAGGVTALTTGEWEWLLPAGALALTGIAATKIFVVEPGWPRWVLVAALAALAGVAMVAFLPVGRDAGGIMLFDPVWTSMFFVGLLGTWILVNVLLGVRP